MSTFCSNYYVNNIKQFLKMRIVFVSISTMILLLLLVQFFEPILQMKFLEVELDFSNLLWNDLYTFTIVSSIWDVLKKIFLICSTIALYTISNHMYNLFLYHRFALEKEVKWYDVYTPTNPYSSNEFNLVIGLKHKIKSMDFVSKPVHIVIPETGTFQNILITGTIGMGKTISILAILLQQVIYYCFNKPKEKVAMLALDVKGNLYDNFVRPFALEANREDDLKVIEIGGEYKYNALHKPNLSPLELANRIRRVLEMNSGQSFESFWMDKAEDTVVEILKLIRIDNNNYVSFEDLHIYAIDDKEREKLIARCELKHAKELLSEEQAFDFMSALSYFTNEYEKMEEKIKMFFKSEITRMTKAFITSKEIRDTFCPSKEEINFYGFTEAIKKGHIVALKINANKEPKVAKLIAAYLKLDFQSEILQTLEVDKDPVMRSRIKVILCDEYQEYATANDADFTSQGREARAVTIVATQSYNSIKQALHDNETKTSYLLQTLVNKIWLRSDDEYTINKAVEKIGKETVLKKTISETESNRKAKFNYGIGEKMSDGNKSLSSGVSRTEQKEFLFDKSFFTRGLEAHKAICFLSDGNKIIDPTVVHLQPLFKGRLAIVNNKVTWLDCPDDYKKKDIEKYDLISLTRDKFNRVIKEIITKKEVNESPEPIALGSPEAKEFVFLLEDHCTETENTETVDPVEFIVEESETPVSEPIVVEEAKKVPIDVTKISADDIKL